MRKISYLFKKAFTSMTIMVVPHDSHRSRSLKVPVIGIFAVILVTAVSSGCLLYLSITGMDYKAQHNQMAEKLEFYTEQFNEWDSTVTALKMDEEEFRQLFSLETKDEVLENVDTSFSGSLDIPDLIQELVRRNDSNDKIKDFLREQKDIYLATPKGNPASGRITSPFGKRKDPFTGEMAFHSGIDISSSLGSPIRATADGYVNYSGRTQQSGYIVILKHGWGFSTIYAHNRSNKVKEGQEVKRGDIIGYVGSSGKSTGPHVHYEVWKDGEAVDPQDYIQKES
jgi:murein DD-endopeptidase MepM/ murein hydrolase activator NlpD